MAARKAKKSIRVDFSKVEKGGGKVPEGEYAARVESVEVATSKSSGEDYLAWVFEIQSKNKDADGRKPKFNTSLQPQALWRLRDLLDTLGYDYEQDEATDIPLGELVGLECMVTMTDEMYEGQKVSRMTDYAPLDTKSSKSKRKKDDEDDPEDEPRSRNKRKSKALSAADVEDMDDEELDDLIEKHDLEIPRTAKTRTKKAKAVIDALSDAGLIED